MTLESLCVKIRTFISAVFFFDNHHTFKPKAQVHYCDHTSVVRPSLVFHISDFAETAERN